MDNAPTPLPDEISLRDSILLLRRHFVLWRRQWKLVLAGALAVAVLGFIWAWITVPTYSANLRFMLADNKFSRMGGLSAVLGSFGLQNFTDQDLNKIIEIAGSYRLVGQTLFEKSTIEGQNDYLANHLIRAEKLHDELWAKSRADDKRGFTLEGFTFGRSQIDSFNRQELTALKKLSNYIIGDPETGLKWMNNSISTESGIMSIQFTSKNEALAIEFAKTHYRNLSAYYIEAAVAKERQTYEILRAKTDSIRAALSGKEYAAAKFNDESNALLFNVEKVPAERLAREKQILTLALGESLKNTEVADYALRDQMPYISVVDMPYAPLEANEKDKLKFALGGFFVGFLLTSLFVFLRNVLRNIMQADE